MVTLQALSFFAPLALILSPALGERAGLGGRHEGEATDLLLKPILLDQKISPARRDRLNFLPPFTSFFFPAFAITPAIFLPIFLKMGENPIIY